MGVHFLSQGKNLPTNSSIESRTYPIGSHRSNQLSDRGSSNIKGGVEKRQRDGGLAYSVHVECVRVIIGLCLAGGGVKVKAV